MTAPVADEDLQEAIFEFQQYLSDHKPPLMVADSVDVLLRYPPDFVAAQIQAWVGAQRLEAIDPKFPKLDEAELRDIAALRAALSGGKA